MRTLRFSPTKQQLFKGNIIGFDTETYSNENKFYCCAFYDGNKYYDFFDRKETVKFIKKAKDKTVFTATNLGFDFWVIFKGHEAVGINTLYQQSRMLSAKTYSKQDKFYKNYVKKARKITFIDTLNYAMLSVEKCGEILGIPKLKHPSFIGRKPKNKKEKEEMKLYNRRDAFISREILVYFYKAFEELGATCKMTIASTSMSLFRNKYLKSDYFRHSKEVLLDQFKGYYGGRTEVFMRGKIKDYNYYDINCYSSDTEILTENGFKKYFELKEGENVYSMNEEQNELILNPIKKIFKYDYSGEMINIYNENMNQLVTPNHRIMISKRQRTNKPYYWEKFSYCKASDLNKTYLKFPVARKINGNVKIDKDIIKLLAWYITEGHRLNNKTFEISQSMTVNFKKCQELKVLFNKLRKKGFIIKEKERIQKGKKYLYGFIEWEKIKKFFPNEKLNSYSMVLPNNFLKWGIEERKILYYEMIKGDGSRQKNKISYVSYSRKLLNQFSLLCLSIGFKSSINYKHKVINIKENKNGDATNYKKQIKKYNGVVWCVSVKNLNVVVKRKGKTFISGNSLYPYVMQKYSFPDPNTLRISKENSIIKIKQFEGMSHVKVFCPEMRYPYLPFRSPSKLLFMTGTFSGYYSHFELREAIKLGYKILRVYKTYYYKKTCSPFKDYVKDLYAKRKEYKIKKSNMQYVTKIFLNSLYGKFGQKFQDKENIIPFNHSVEELNKFSWFEFLGENNEFIKVKQDVEPSAFCIPIWASHVTAYARHELYSYFHYTNPVYCDTDSLMTKQTLNTSKELGDMKLEMFVKDGIIVKPKFYYVTDGEEDFVKIKGVQKKVNVKDENNIKSKTALSPEIFKSILEGEGVSYNKFIKLKESLRRGISVNSIIEVTKLLNLNDNKRLWRETFNYNEIQDSEPINADLTDIKEHKPKKEKTNKFISCKI